MRLNFFFIFFSLILGILTLNLKKKSQKNKYPNEKDSLLKQQRLCMKNPFKLGEECGTNVHCTTFNCDNGICRKAIGYRGTGANCLCDYHCPPGHTCNYTPNGFVCSRKLLVRPKI